MRLHDPYLSTLSRSGEFGSISPPSFSRFPPSSSFLGSLFLFLFFFLSVSSHLFQPSFLPPKQLPAFIHDLNSLSHVQDVLFASFGLNFRWEESVKERHATEHAAAADRHWEEEGHLFSLLAFILHIN
jgi:hypothetical protein